MSTTVTLKNLGAFAGATNLQLFLRKTSDNTLLAAGGDTGVDASSIGSFAWTVAEEIPSEQLLARIYEGSTETAANIVIDSVLNVGFTEIGQEAAELNTAQYDAIIAAAEGSALTGPYTRTVTVTDSDTSTAIQNAKVRLYRTGETGTEPTNVSGVATFTVEAATWSYAITANGYTGVAGTIAVSANGNTPIALVAATVTPPTNPSLSAIEVLCLGVDFEAESDIDIDFRIAEIATGDQNKTYPGAKVTVSSDSNGIARWEAPQGFVVEYKRGNTHSWQRVTLDSDSSTNVTSVIGSP